MAASFRNDYDSLCHPRILEALSAHLGEHFTAYGGDEFSKKAGQRISEIFGAKGAKTYFLAGGTQANLVMISAALRPYEAVISCDTGHINVHETGAVEGTGHKILAVPNHNGKLTAEGIAEAIAKCDSSHVVKPKMVYISNSTEIGTIYHKNDLLSLRKVCDKYGLYLFLDGARLGSALTSEENDVKPEEIGQLCDCFYVGGTKNGALFGEALVINNPALAMDMDYHIKNRGALLAKGFVAGIMFDELFKDGLYFELAQKANGLAKKIKEGAKALGYPVVESSTNQVFVDFKKEIAGRIIERYNCEKWEDKGEMITLRFVTSFLTEEKDVDELLSFLSKIA